MWRSTDNGATWASWDDARLQGLDYTSHMSAAAVSPLLGDGTYRLIIGTANGQVWVLDPAQMAWKAQAETVAAAVTPAAVQAASPLPLPTPTPSAAVTTSTTVTAGTEVTASTGVTATTALTGEATAAPAATPGAPAEPLAGDPPDGFFRPEGSTALVWQNNLARPAGPGLGTAGKSDNDRRRLPEVRKRHDGVAPGYQPDLCLFQRRHVALIR